jgi:hypothetical protein
MLGNKKRYRVIQHSQFFSAAIDDAHMSIGLLRIRFGYQPVAVHAQGDGL